MTEKEWEKIKHAKVKYDPSLDKYRDISLCPDKVAKCRETIKKIGLPEEFYKKK